MALLCSNVLFYPIKTNASTPTFVWGFEEKRSTKILRNHSNTGESTKAHPTIRNRENGNNTNDTLPWVSYQRHVYISSSFLLSSSTRRRFYPQRSSGQATGVVPSPPRYVPSFLWRIAFSIPTAHPFSSNVANSRSRAPR